MSDLPIKPRTEADAVAELSFEGLRFPEPVDPSDIRIAILHDEAGSERVEVVDLEGKLDEPRRKLGVFRPADVASFVDYTKNHHDDNDSTVWIERESATITAVLNDHSEAHAGWGDHKAVLVLERTPEWKHWQGGDGKWFSQADFAEHVQHGIGEIVLPEPATMLEIAQSLEGKVEANWQTARRLDNGEVGFQYTETVTAGAGRQGSLEIPAEFTLEVIPFYGEDRYPVTARLRYRVREGVLTIGYQLVQPHEVELSVLHEVQTRLTETFPRVYMGKPRA